MTTEQIAENNEALDADRIALQEAITNSGIKASQKIVWEGKGKHVVTADLNPYSVVKSPAKAATDTEPAVEAGAAWTLYQYAINGFIGLYPQPKLPKGTYKLVLTQNAKNPEKGGNSWLPM